jgi:hypothetical protein
MKTRRALIPLAAGLFILWVAAYGDELGARDARLRIAEALHLDNPKNVHVRSINEGMGGQAIVEASIDAAFRLEQKEGRWKAVEVRTGDRSWESFELIETAIRKEKILRTTADMRAIATAIEAFRRERGHYVAAKTASALIDNIAPAYLGSVIRRDAWSHEFQYSGDASRYRLVSLGPDGRADTGDEIVIENGEVVKGAGE